MPISRGLVISLGTSMLGCTLLFLYFRNRMSVIERKVDVMFDLIQNHNQQQQPMGYEGDPQNMQFSVREKEVEGEDNEDSRIVVSEDEASDDDAFDSDDSDEVSDNEEEDISLNLNSSENIEISDIKTITLDGPENKVDNVEVDSLDDIDDDDEDVNDNDDSISADKQDKEEEDHDDVQDDVHDDVQDDDQDDEDDDNGEEELTVKEIDYSGLKVSELKSIAQERELNGYKSLKKNALINLLKANE